MTRLAVFFEEYEFCVLLGLPNYGFVETIWVQIDGYICVRD